MGPRDAAPLYVIGKLPHFLARRDSAAFTARQGCVGFLDRGQYLEAPPLALFPQQHGLLDRVFLAAKSARVDGMTHESLLIGRQAYFHDMSVRVE
jgi:hypothetical protein